ncbi:protein of unknown function [Methylotuvimicrobium alcaliphilum 20Z]|uniref:Uncharacterized protein n=1 Tax=Methylotuvimicrobium alcaliphilum (strain DSM 19304 / NCIMB 14124 / VKM B-2133 / 20Z) TaxID=1091494 RepID=G4T412_META2|nr:protein of unknown function [Methylotuvimicrobium alcaliphilum 20Z]
MLAEVGDRLYTQGCLKPFVSVGGTLLVALDGTELDTVLRLAFGKNRE